MRRKIAGYLVVTQTDIDAARELCARGVNAHSCPLALALARQLDVSPRAVYAHPDFLSVPSGRFDRGSELKDRFESTPTLRRFMRRWDRRREATPGRFTLYARD